MNRDNFIELTNRVYRITLLFPKKEPLRYKIREKADDVLADLVFWETWQKDVSFEKGDERETIFNAEKDLEILRSYFDVAKWQNWVSYFDILDIEQEYDKIKNRIQKEKTELIKPEREFQREEAIIFSKSLTENRIEEQLEAKKYLDERKEKILGLLREKGKLQVGEVSRILSQVSKRTLRRDFVQLLEMDLIKRIGEKNETFYQLK